MTTSKLNSRLLPMFLIASVLFTACEVPDISKFTDQSAEMTRGIRKGVKDTENLLKAASERDDLFSDTTIADLEVHLKNYKNAMKPTVAALDALDAYLEALNALALANKKSGENSGAVVSAVSNLVTAATGFTAASSTVNLATGLLTLAEEFRATKDFKKRVNLAAEIVEGVHPDKDENGKQKKDKNGQLIFLRKCTEDAGVPITEASRTIRDIAGPILENLTKDEIKQLKLVPAESKWEELHRLGKLDNATLAKIIAAIKTIDDYGCGVIDFIKFNIQDLQKINLKVSDVMYTNAREKNRVVLGFYESIVANDRRVQNELGRILEFKALIPVINQYVNNGADSRAVETKITLKNTLDSIFILDPDIRTAVIESIQGCGNCGAMLTVLQTDTDRSRCNATCRSNLKTTIQGITRPQFDKSDSLIEGILDKKSATLFEQNQRYLADLARIKPSYDSVNAELNSMKDIQNQLDSLLDSSLTALDAWSETHANLRIAVNTKKTLSASKLTSKVREIWAIINPETN